MIEWLIDPPALTETPVRERLVKDTGQNFFLIFNAITTDNWLVNVAHQSIVIRFRSALYSAIVPKRPVVVCYVIVIWGNNTPVY